LFLADIDGIIVIPEERAEAVIVEIEQHGRRQESKKSRIQESRMNTGSVESLPLSRGLGVEAHCLFTS